MATVLQIRAYIRCPVAGCPAFLELASARERACPAAGASPCYDNLQRPCGRRLAVLSANAPYVGQGGLRRALNSTGCEI
jgi:hypothetical protein